jgi:hypothetical protein
MTATHKVKTRARTGSPSASSPLADNSLPASALIRKFKSRVVACGQCGRQPVQIKAFISRRVALFRFECPGCGHKSGCGGDSVAEAAAFWNEAN